jgi:hypothetical protein
MAGGQDLHFGAKHEVTPLSPPRFHRGHGRVVGVDHGGPQADAAAGEVDCVGDAIWKRCQPLDADVRILEEARHSLPRPIVLRPEPVEFSKASNIVDVQLKTQVLEHGISKYF